MTDRCGGRSSRGGHNVWCPASPVYVIAVGPEVAQSTQPSEEVTVYACGRHLAWIINRSITDDGSVLAIVRKKG